MGLAAPPGPFLPRTVSNPPNSTAHPQRKHFQLRKPSAFPHLNCFQRTKPAACPSRNCLQPAKANGFSLPEMFPISQSRRLARPGNVAGRAKPPRGSCCYVLGVGLCPVSGMGWASGPQNELGGRRYWRGPAAGRVVARHGGPWFWLGQPAEATSAPGYRHPAAAPPASAGCSG